MPRLLLLTGVILLMADYSFAQYSPDPTPMQCQLIRLAVAQYGYAAARQHALETYGPEAVKTGDKCFTKGRARPSSLRRSKRSPAQKRPDTWSHRPMLQSEDTSCQPGAVHTWPADEVTACPFSRRVFGVERSSLCSARAIPGLTLSGLRPLSGVDRTST